jgi:deoxyribonuclease-4
MLFGAHCSTAGGLYMALRRAREIHGDICQIFVKNNMQWFGKPPSEEEQALYKAEFEKSRLSCVFGHAGYLINLAAPASQNRQISIRSLIQEMEFATRLGLPFLVLHPGAHLGTGEKAGLHQAVAGLNEVFEATKKSPVRIALENTAGQGSCLGCKISHLAFLFDHVNRPERLGVCLDTAHFFAAGYDIRKRTGWDGAIDEVAKLIGLRQILALHLNDSKTALGSRVDRHEHIGDGQIGKEGFRNIVNDRRFKKIPGCLETPKSKELKEDIQNLVTLRSLVAVDRPARITPISTRGTGALLRPSAQL